MDIPRFRITKIYSNDNEKNHLEHSFQEILSLFEAINTEPLLTAFVKEKFNYVYYEGNLLGKRFTRKKYNQKLELGETNKDFIYIPILDSLQQLLFNDRTSKMFFRTKRFWDGDVFYDIYDGSLYQNGAYVFEKIHAL